MSKKRKAKIEYKETEVFELFPTFDYTTMQRKRVTLFHAYAKNFKKIINYASHFDAPNKICLVYIVGTVKDGAIEQALNAAECSDRVCVLVADFPDEQMQFWHDYDEFRQKYKGSGLWDENADAPTEQLLTDKKRLRDYYASYMANKTSGQMSLMGLAEDYDDCANQVSEYDNMMETIRRYEKLKNQCGSVYFKHFRLHRIGHKEKPFTHDRLNALISRIFPFGAESMGVKPFAFLSPASVQPAIEFVTNGIENKRLGITEDMIAPCAKALAGAIRKSIAEHGYCTLMGMRSVIEAPPFGMGYDGFSAACVTTALNRFSNRTMILYDGCSHFEMRGLEQSVFELMFCPTNPSRRARIEKACLYLESSPHKKVKQFMAKLWGIKILMPGATMGLYLGRDLCATHRVPLAYVDDRLLNLTMWGFDFWDRAKVQSLADEIEAHGSEILSSYERYKRENSSIPEKAKSLMQTDYSWAWSSEEYEDILWQTEKYGAWPWDTETHRKVREETEKRHGEKKVYVV